MDQQNSMFNMGYEERSIRNYKLFAEAKLNWDSQVGKLFSLPYKRNFPISFKPKVAIAVFFWKMQRKTWYPILGVRVSQTIGINVQTGKLMLATSFSG